MLIGVALMFFAPLALSFYLYYGKAWHPGGRVNAGELIEPARPLPALALPLAASANGAGARANQSAISQGQVDSPVRAAGAAAMMNAAGIYMTRARCVWRSIAKWIACSGSSSAMATAAT